MILDTVLRMEAAIDELKGMVVCNEWPRVNSHSLNIVSGYGLRFKWDE